MKGFDGIISAADRAGAAAGCLERLVRRRAAVKVDRVVQLAHYGGLADPVVVVALAKVNPNVTGSHGHARRRGERLCQKSRRVGQHILRRSLIELAVKGRKTHTNTQKRID